MRKIYALLLLSSFCVVFSQEKVSDSAWAIKGQNTLMLNQAAFSNWIGGGSNNVGFILGANYAFTYEKDKDLWENNINLGYGQNNTQGTGSRKTQDVLKLSSNYGRKISKNWYTSVGLGIESQFAPGYEDGNNPDALKISNFMSPGYIDLGVGFTYKPNEDLSVSLRPANARLILVLDKDLQQKGNYGLENDGDSTYFQFGFLGTARYKLKVMENITLMNEASVFSNYLKNPERLVLSYSGILNMKINKYISSNITFDARYDHNQIQKTQIKQTLGIGVAYNIDNGVKRSKK